MTTSEDREKALQVALDKVRKDFGPGAAMVLGDQPDFKVNTIPSGSLAIDIATHLDGYPRGRIIEVYGPESSGKTLLTLNAIAQVQKQGGTALFIDAEYAFDPKWAAKLGVDVKKLLFAQPNNGEEAFEIAETFIRSGAVDIVVIDSVAALTPKKELDGDMGDSLPGLQARLMSQGLRKITAAIAKSDATVFFINQLREKIGVFFGSPETTTGGKALKFYASMRLDVRRIETLKGSDATAVGARTRMKVIKNKVASPFGVAEFDVFFQGAKVGYTRGGDLRDIGEKMGIIKKAGASYSYNGERLAIGKDKLREFLEDPANAAIADSIEKEIRAAAAKAYDPSAAEESFEDAIEDGKALDGDD